MNRETRRKDQKVINRQIRQRERELRRNVRLIDWKSEDGYMNEEEAIQFLEKLSKFNHKQKRKYED